MAIRDRVGLIQVFAPSTGSSWITRAQTSAVEWEPAFRPLGDATPAKEVPPLVVLPGPAPALTPVSPTYAPRRIVVDLKANAKAGRTSTVFKGLAVRGVPAGATVTATCAKGCRLKTLTVRNEAGTVSLKGLFVKRATQWTLAQGTKVRVVISAPNSIAAVKTLTVRARRAPSVATRCLAPGAATESLCAA